MRKNPVPYQDINEQLRDAYICKFGNKSQVQLTKHLAKNSPSSISRIFNGQQELTACDFFNICTILETKPSEIKNVTSSANSKTDLKHYKVISNEEIGNVLKKIRADHFTLYDFLGVISNQGIGLPDYQYIHDREMGKTIIKYADIVAYSKVCAIEIDEIYEMCKHCDFE